MRFRRATLLANVVLIGATVPALSHVVASTSTSARPLYEYVNSGSTTWSTRALAATFNGHLVLGSAHAASGDGVTALAARLDNGDLGLSVTDANGATSFTDLSAAAAAPAAAGDPQVFIDPDGSADLLYVSVRHRLVLITPAMARYPRHSHFATPDPSSSPWRVVDLSVASHVPMAASLPSISLAGRSALVVDRSTKNDAVAIPLQWRQWGLGPAVGVAANVTLDTATPTLGNDPVTAAGITNAFTATTTAGHVEFFSQAAGGASAWTASDVTALTTSATSSGPLSMAANASQLYVAGLSSLGHVQLFNVATTRLAYHARHVVSHLLSRGARPQVITPLPAWGYHDLTATITGSPLWTGQVFVSASDAGLAVAGRAAALGDLYAYSASLPQMTWTSSDVSEAAGASTSASTGVTGLSTGSSLQLFAPSDGALPPTGVGVYAIPYNDWGRAITDGWPIVSETGGLGTLSAPWVGFPATTSVTQSSDYLMGQAIANAQHRETWLSFWTVSGPLSPATQTPATYYSHGYSAGQWVAQQIDQYHLNGVGLKPNWVILDPEGYPDNHSALDAPGGSSPSTVHKSAAYWAAMLAGWSKGLTDVDPSIKPGVYASMSEYRDYGLAGASMPVFEAVAFAGGGPVRVAGSDGHNILGYIAFDATCTPSATLHAQEHTLVSAPWSGQFNTLQFNPGVYCAP